MNIINNLIEYIFGLALFINAILFIPQAVRIIKNKTAHDISLSTFIGFLIIQFTIVLHGVITHDAILIIGYLFSMVTCGTVVVIAFLYRRKKYSEISAEEIIDQLPGHIYWKNIDGVFIGSNHNNWKDFKLASAADYFGKTDYDLFSEEQADNIRRVDVEVMKSGKTTAVEEKVSIGQEKIIYLSHKTPLRDRRNKIIGILGVSLNVTDNRKEEFERLNFLENIIAMMPGHVYWVNRDGIYLGCNDNQARSAGLVSRKEIYGKRNKDLPWNFNAGVLPEALDKINEEVMTTGKTVIIEEPARLQDGTEALFLSNKAPIIDSNENIVGMVGISIDITEKKQTEKELFETQNKLEGMTIISASIAHELRTPLSSLNISISNIKDLLLPLIEAFKLAKKAGLQVHNIRDGHLKVLEQSLTSMHKEIGAAFTFIDMLLLNLNPTMDQTKIETFSIINAIEEALDRYPFELGQKQLVKCPINNNGDFRISGERLLITHVLFNLIKNALYYVTKAGKGEITIWLEKDDKNNILHFKDTGTGIDKDILPHIFDRFFSKTYHGAGVGLTFCKWVMENLNGSIECLSVKDEYTHFLLYFPIKGSNKLDS